MTIHRSTFHKYALSTVLFAAALGSAHAQDTTAVADRLKALLANQGVDLVWTGISGDASSMVMEGVSVKPAAEKDALPPVAEQTVSTGSTDAHQVDDDDAVDLPDVSQFLTKPTSPADLDFIPDYDDDE